MKKAISIGEKSTSVTIGRYYENFIKCEILLGRYKSASEVFRAALRLLEKEELKAEELRKLKN